MNILHSSRKHFKLRLWNVDSGLQIKGKVHKWIFGEELQEYLEY
jgi:hypothetical protein